MAVGHNDPAARTSLLPVLGLAFGIAVSIGGTLGVGILRQPGPVAAYLREPWLIMAMWAAGGVYAALGVLNVAELATMIPRAGGFYVFARQAMGNNIGFAVGWSDFLANIASTATAALAAAEFLARLVPGAGQAKSMVATLAILAFAVIQWFGIRLSGRVQQAVSAIAAMGLLALILACLASHTARHTQALQPAGMSVFAAMILAIQSIVVTYDGWYEPIYFAEETHHAARSLPRAMFGGLALLTSIYLLLNLGLLRVLGTSGLAASKFAAADAGGLIFGTAGETIIAVMAIAILLALLHSVLMGSTRILFAISRDGLFWGRAEEVDANGTPKPALAIASVVAAGMVVSGTVDRLIAITGFFVVANYSWAYLSLMVLRRTQPEAVRPFRVPAYPFLTLLVLGASLAFLAGAAMSDRTNSVYALGLLLVSFLVRLLLRAMAA